MVSLFSVFSCVASRVSARQPTHFSLLRQRKVSKRKASRRQGRCAVPCAARSRRVGRKLGFASNMRPPDPPAAALLSPVSTAGEMNSQYQLRSLGFAIANSRNNRLSLDVKNVAQRSASSILWSHSHPSASAARRDTTSTACKVRASARARGTRSPDFPPLGRAEQRSVGRIRAGACLSEASLRQIPPNASSAGNPAGARSLARLSFGYFSLAKQRKVARLPGRHPACHANQTATHKRDRSPTC